MSFKWAVCWKNRKENRMSPRARACVYQSISHNSPSSYRQKHQFEPMFPLNFCSLWERLFRRIWLCRWYKRFNCVWHNCDVCVCVAINHTHAAHSVWKHRINAVVVAFFSSSSSVISCFMYLTILQLVKVMNVGTYVRCRFLSVRFISRAIQTNTPRYERWKKAK